MKILISLLAKLHVVKKELGIDLFYQTWQEPVMKDLIAIKNTLKESGIAMKEVHIITEIGINCR